MFTHTLELVHAKSKMEGMDTSLYINGKKTIKCLNLSMGYNLQNSHFETQKWRFHKWFQVPRFVQSVLAPGYAPNNQELPQTPSQDGKDRLPTNVFQQCFSSWRIQPNWKTVVLVKWDHETPIFGMKNRQYLKTPPSFRCELLVSGRICIIWYIGSHFEITCSPTQ